MEEIRVGKYTVVHASDERTHGNSHHEYSIYESLLDDGSMIRGNPMLQVKFQNGPILESGVNGIMNEDLISIVIDRLQGFQGSKFACRENALALTKLEEALMWLENRTAKREKRGVEGTHTV